MKALLSFPQYIRTITIKNQAEYERFRWAFYQWEEEQYYKELKTAHPARRFRKSSPGASEEELMTNQAIQELRRWSAEELMGLELGSIKTDEGSLYYDKKSKAIPVVFWRPDDPTTGQIWMVLDKMQRCGFNFCLILRQDMAVAVCFTKKHNFQGEGNYEIAPCLAILLAARAALEGGHP
jgi:hypothetical protein